MVQSILPVFQLIIAACNICVLAFGFYKFLGKPHSTLESRVAVLEDRADKMETSLKQGGKKFVEHDKALEVLTKNVLALVEFEMNYCLKEDYPASKGLEKSKEELNEYLSSKKGTEL